MSRVYQLLKIAHGDKFKILTVDPTITVFEVAKLFQEKRVGAFPVMEGEVMVGIISERDLVTRVLAKDLNPKTTLVKEVMTPDPNYVSPFTDIMDCMSLMKEMDVRHMPVLENSKLVGIVSIRDILHTLWKTQELLAQQFEQYVIGRT